MSAGWNAKTFAELEALASFGDAAIGVIERIGRSY